MGLLQRIPHGVVLVVLETVVRISVDRGNDCWVCDWIVDSEVLVDAVRTAKVCCLHIKENSSGHKIFALPVVDDLVKRVQVLLPVRGIYQRVPPPKSGLVGHPHFRIDVAWVAHVGRVLRKIRGDGVAAVGLFGVLVLLLVDVGPVRGEVWVVVEEDRLYKSETIRDLLLKGQRQSKERVSTGRRSCTCLAQRPTWPDWRLTAGIRSKSLRSGCPPHNRG